MSKTADNTGIAPLTETGRRVTGGKKP